MKLTWESVDPLAPFTIEPHLAELVLVQALAFARSSVEAIGVWHDGEGISFDRRVQVKLKSEQGRSVVNIRLERRREPR